VPRQRIAVIGSGNIGGTLAGKWVAAGHPVIFGTRDPASPRDSTMKLGPGARVTTVEEAVSAADVVLFAVPGRAMPGLVAGLGAALNGRIVIDAANRIGEPSLNSLAEIAAAAPDAHAYRAFNIYGWENFRDPTFGPEHPDLFFAGPDGPSRTAVEGLISDVGLRPVWVGGPEEAGAVDGLLTLWFTLSGKRGMGRHLAFRLLSDSRA
jgi:predicted dinucleotide-binding enzyme